MFWMLTQLYCLLISPVLDCLPMLDVISYLWSKCMCMPYSCMISYVNEFICICISDICICDLCFISAVWSYFNMDINKVNNLQYLWICFFCLLIFRRKDLCEARVKPKMSSNFQMTFPDKLSDIPPCLKLPVTGDEIFTDLCHQWEPIWNRQQN